MIINAGFLLLTCIVLLPPVLSEGADSRPLRPRAVVVETHADEKFGALSLRAETSPPPNSRISALSIRWLGRDIVVPPDAYADLELPDIASFVCSVWEKSGDRVELEVTFRIYDRRYFRVDRPAHVTLIVFEGQLETRTITWADGPRKRRSETKRFKA